MLRVTFLFHDMKKHGGRVTKERFLQKSIVVDAFFMIKDIQKVAFIRRPREAYGVERFQSTVKA